MKIDVHAHYVPRDCMGEVKGSDGRTYGLRIVQEGSEPVAYSAGHRNIGFEAEQIYSVERRLKDMGTQRVDMQVLSVPPFFFFYAIDPAQSLGLCQKINDAFAETI